MKKTILILLCIAISVSMLACSGETETLQGVAKGYGGEVSVEVTMKGDKITKVVAKGDKETPEIGGLALEEISNKIVEANSADVDAVSGATVTSNAIMSAVKNAIEPDK